MAHYGESRRFHFGSRSAEFWHTTRSMTRSRSTDNGGLAQTREVTSVYLRARCSFLKPFGELLAKSELPLLGRRKCQLPFRVQRRRSNVRVPAQSTRTKHLLTPQNRTLLGRSGPTPTPGPRLPVPTIREEEADLSFLDFDGTRRHPGGTEPHGALPGRKPPRVTTRRATGTMARREGFEPPTLRFEEESEPEQTPPLAFS